MNERNIALRRALVKAVIAITVIVAVATVVLSVREHIFLPRAFMLVVLILGGSTAMLDLVSSRIDTQILVALMLLRLLVVALAAATILDFILRQRLPMLYTRRSKRMQNHVILCGLGTTAWPSRIELSLSYSAPGTDSIPLR